MPSPEEARVARRTVFYIEGYDPRGPSHYHGLYRDEAAKQAGVNGLELSVGPRRKIDSISSAWTVWSATTETNYIFLRYDDLMRQRWSKTNIAVLFDILRYACAYLRRGVYIGMYRLSWPFLVFTILAPALVLIAILLSVLCGVVFGQLYGWAPGLAIMPAVFAGLVFLRPWLEPRMTAFWLARVFAFTADQGSGRAPDMEARIDAFAESITREVETGEADEVLVVGHSVGSHIAVSACARALKRLDASTRGFSFMTLGHTIPLLGLQPGASAFREELRQAASDPRLDWIDFSAAADGVCFPLTDPLWGSGVAQPDPAKPKPKLLSARYPKLFTPAAYRKIKRDFYRAHFQYLMATELPGDYDYFLITAGDMKLARRYAHLASVTNYDRFRTSRR